MNSIIKKLSLTIAAALIIASCSSADVKQQYLLETPENLVPVTGQFKTLPAISVSLVQAVNYASKQMEYTRAANEVEYFTKSEWAVPPSKMIQTQIVRALNQSQLFTDVVTLPSDLKTTLRLDLHLLEMRHYFDANNQSYVILELQSRVVNPASGQILMTQTYKEQEPSLQYNARGGVDAYNLAFERIMQQIVRDLTQLNR